MLPLLPPDTGEGYQTSRFIIQNGKGLTLTSWQKIIYRTSIHIEPHWLRWRMNHGWHTLSINKTLVYFLKKSETYYFHYYLEFFNGNKENFASKIQMKQLWPPQMTSEATGWRTMFPVVGWQAVSSRSMSLGGEWPQLRLSGGFFAICAWVLSDKV